MGGDLAKAVALAGSLPAADEKVLLLCAGGDQRHCVYNLTDGLSIPPNTTLIGSDTAILQFTVATSEPSKGTCGAVLNRTDFYLHNCSGPTCFQDLSVTRNASGSMEQCCDRCRHLAKCTAYTYEAQQGGICILKTCPNKANKCQTSPSVGATSAYFDSDRHLRATAAIVVSDGVTLANLTVLITAQTNTAGFKAVHMPKGTRRFVGTGLVVTMQQNNVSNAFFIEGQGFEIAHSRITQEGSCMWPGYGPDSDRTPFQPSTTIYFHGAVDGWFHDNVCFWRCSFMDLDVSDRVRFEGNEIHSTEHGVVPHGNSISGYDYRLHPSSRWWSFARNLMTRPANKTNVRSWTQRETLTTDGSGEWAPSAVIEWAPSAVDES
jgi:hypothetical protein